jgi:hypothetical protein
MAKKLRNRCRSEAKTGGSRKGGTQTVHAAKLPSLEAADKVCETAKNSILSEARQRKKVRKIAEELREEGFDEAAVARAHVFLVGNLLQNKKPNGSEKLLADELKEISRTLEPTGSAAAGGTDADSPVTVQMIHGIPRPWRARTAESVEGAAEHFRAAI